MGLREQAWKIGQSAIGRGLALGLIPGHTRYTRFIIGGMGRTGSNFLSSSLRSHSRVIAYGELFNNAHHERIGWAYPGPRSTPGLVELRERAPLEFIDEVVFRKAPRRIGAVGFKLFYYHAREEHWACVWPHLKEMDVKVVHLKRRDLLALLLSMTKALESREWSTTKEKQGKEGSISLAYEDCLKGFETVQRWQKEFDAFFPEHLEIHYEDILDDYHGQMRRVQEYLGVEYQPTHSPLKKQSVLPLHQAIANYGELRERFSDGPWAYLFDPPPR